MNAQTIAVCISAGSLVISALALWRSGHARVLDLRTAVRKDIAELRMRIDDLAKTIPVALRSRQNVTAAVGRSGAIIQFESEAKEDADSLPRLRQELESLEPIPWFAMYGTMESKAVAVHAIRHKLGMLAEKYVLAAEADGEVRKHLREAALRRVDASRNQPPP